MWGDKEQELLPDGPKGGLMALYVIKYTISTDGFLAFADAGLVFKQRMCADRHKTHLAHVFGSLQYTLQSVTKDLHKAQAAAKGQWSSVPTTAEPELVPAVVKATHFSHKMVTWDTM